MSLTRFTRRQFLKSTAVLGAAVSLTSLAGCVAPTAPQAGSGGAAAPAAAKETVLFWKPPHSSKEADLWTPLLKKFTDANPNITIDHQVIPWANVDQQFTAAFAGGQPPDVFYLPDEWYPKYVNQDQIADLTDKIGSWKENYTPTAWGIATYKGSTWGAPFLGVVQGWILNMDLFKAKGVAKPTNWEEFRAAAKELTDKNAGVYGVNPFGGDNVTNWTVEVPLLAAGGTKLLSDDLKKVTANTEGGVLAVKTFLQDIVFNDQSATPVGSTSQQRLELGLTGKIAMFWQEESSIKAQWRARLPNAELDAIPMLKLTDDGHDAAWANVGFMFMAKSSADKDGAFKLLEYLSTDDIQVEYVQKGVDLLPLKKNIPPLPDVDPLVAKLVSFLEAGDGVGTQISIHWRDACNSLVAECEAVMSGTKTPDQALASVVDTVGPILDGE